MMRFITVLSFVVIAVSEETYDTGTNYVLNFASPVYVCPDEASKAFIDTSNVEVLRINETTAIMTGYINVHKGVDHGSMLDIWIEREISGRFEMLVSHEICDLCSHMGNGDSFYYTYIKYFGFPDECPLTAGKYYIHDLVTDTTDLPVNAANAGRYQVTINFYHTTSDNCRDQKTFVGCLKLDCLIELA